tara:strand:+ start:138 stop:587 length:450 start_codon:yes stop_codon:yes gene_type:complete
LEHLDVETLVNAALDTLYRDSSELIWRDVGERTICADLARLLGQSFVGFRVDCEYNRHGVEIKGVDLPDKNGELVRHSVFPDIIVHQIGHDRDNLIVIEVKKSTNPVKDDNDLVKLERIKLRMRYKHALFIRLSTGDQYLRERCELKFV